MKSNRLWLVCITLILSIISTVGCNSPVAAGETTARIPSSTVDGKDGIWYMPSADAYEFPFTPGKEPEQWKAVDSKVRHDRQNLPEDILKTISTAGLAESCMNNEFFLDFSFFSPFYYEGAIGLFEYLNSGRELYTREDAATELIRLYKSININALFSSVRSGMFKLDYLEFIISSEKFIQQMTRAQRIDLMSRESAATQRISQIFCRKPTQKYLSSLPEKGRIT